MPIVIMKRRWKDKVEVEKKGKERKREEKRRKGKKTH